MNIRISSVHFDADKKLLDFTHKKVGKMMKFYEGIVAAEVIFKVEKTTDFENKIAEIKFEIPGNDVFSKKQCKTFEESVDSALDALKKQLTKQKEKQRGL